MEPNWLILEFTQSSAKTLAAGWLTGGHPTVAQGEVARTVKFEWTDDVKRERNIRVINCDTHFVYFLGNTHIANWAIVLFKMSSDILDALFTIGKLIKNLEFIKLRI